MDRKNVSKSCKCCLALIGGISLAFIISKMLEDKDEKEDCQCGA